MKVPPVVRLILALVAVLLLWAGTRASRPDTASGRVAAAEHERRGVAPAPDRF